LLRRMLDIGVAYTFGMLLKIWWKHKICNYAYPSHIKLLCSQLAR